MSEYLDQKFSQSFQAEAVRDTFLLYEEAKRDFFDESHVNIQVGADGISYETFKKELELRSQFISKKVLSGKYQFYPLREVNIPKPSGGERVLSISTIRDVLVQKLLYDVVYSEVEAKFRRTHSLDQASWAYRKSKSAPRAATLIHRYIQQGFRFALDADIVKFFDEIPHGQLIELIENYFGKDTLTSNLLKRFIRTGGVPYCDENNNIRGARVFHHYKPDRQEILRSRGIPQGGVLSGILANLYLHKLDRWLTEDLSCRYKLKYIRYADDFVVLVKEELDIPFIHQEISGQLHKLELRLHNLGEKTKYVDILEDRLKFVGFSFDGIHIRVHQDNIKRFQDRIESKLSETEDRRPSKIEADYNFGKRPKRRLNLFIERVINRKIVGRDDICQICGKLSEKRVRNWVGFFSACTDSKQFHQLDEWIRIVIGRYFWRQYGVHLKRADFRKAGLRSLEQEYYRIRQKKFCECSTDIELPDFSSNI